MENPAVNIRLHLARKPSVGPLLLGVAGVERLLGEAAGEGECLRNRSDGQRAPMPQLKAGKRNSSAEVPSGHKNDPHESVYRQLFGGTNSFAL